MDEKEIKYWAKHTIKPEIIEDSDDLIYAKMVVELHRCSLCKVPSIEPVLKLREYSPFPHWRERSFNVQLASVGWNIMSHTEVDGERICEVCEKSGKASFKCALCDHRYTTDLIERRYGDPPEFLCKICYANTPANIWEKKDKALSEAHRYDYD